MYGDYSVTGEGPNNLKFHRMTSFPTLIVWEAIRSGCTRVVVDVLVPEKKV